ncbi:hypothetical protein [Streptomyces sp. NBC_01408]|uniref:hypothetical protein n=1 Tax=Streptomyces sp. NBC_01408 TaxID=2903855 RepID=UPI002257772C|nr:hypothetical protein [Streptomyces sp. NBC_01408]MCX4691775.1 hypothetical protein [Streptomyces sp. NBC_01408]
MRLPRTALALLALSGFVAGCGGPGADDRSAEGKSTMNMQQGAERADVILQETLAAIQPEVLWNHSPGGEAGCTKGVAGAPTGTGAAKRTVSIMTIVSEQRRGALMGVIERDWKGRGYTITSVNNSAEVPAIHAETPEGYTLSVKVGGGQFFLDAGTPCLTDHPVQEPRTKPNTHHRKGQFPQRPDTQDEFWSATTPLPSGSPAPAAP